jgi:hypothetical protein
MTFRSDDMPLLLLFFFNKINIEIVLISPPFLFLFFVFLIYFNNIEIVLISPLSSSLLFCVFLIITSSSSYDGYYYYQVLHGIIILHATKKNERIETNATRK